MTLLFLFLVILLYDSIGAVVVLMCSNYSDDVSNAMFALVFWPLPVFGRIGIALYRIFRRLTK